MLINANTKICLLIGDPVDKSLSPILHNNGYRILGKENEFVYLACRVKPEHLKQAVDGIRALGIAGASVTIPHKVKILDYLDHIDAEAEQIGAVNTLYWKEKKLTGTNTDWLGVLNPLSRLIDLKNKTAALVGAGGAARAACYAFKVAGVKFAIFNRTVEKVQKLAEEFGAEAETSGNFQKLESFDIVVNSVPYSEKQPPFSADMLRKNQIFFDMIYAPHRTALIKQASAKGLRVIHGVEMLLEQGIEQFRLFTQIEAPYAEIREALLNYVEINNL